MYKNFSLLTFSLFTLSGMFSPLNAQENVNSNHIANSEIKVQDASHQITTSQKADIQVSTMCQGDSLAIFTLKNIGDLPTDDSFEFIISEEEIISRQESFSLKSGESVEITEFSVGQKWQLEVTKNKDGDKISATLEGCGSPSSNKGEVLSIAKNNPKNQILNELSIIGNQNTTKNTNLYNQSDEQQIQFFSENATDSIVWRILGNPVQTVCTFISEKTPKTDKFFLLYDCQGKLVRQTTFNGNSYEFYVNNLKHGLYYFSITSPIGQESNGRLLVE